MQARFVHSVSLLVLGFDARCNEIELLTDYSLCVRAIVYFFLRLFCLLGGATLGVGAFFCTRAGVIFCPTSGSDGVARTVLADGRGVRAGPAVFTAGDNFLDDRLATVFLVMAWKTNGQISGARLFFQ